MCLIRGLSPAATATGVLIEAAPITVDDTWQPRPARLRTPPP
jgi:hypothetical protein